MEPLKVWDLPITDGAILRSDVPYEGHKRGKNWLAVIHRDPRSPGGLGRDFMARGHGPYAYIAEDIPEGSALECGADYYSGGGRPSRERHYYLLLRKRETAWQLAEYPTAGDVFAAQREYVPPLRSDKTRLITVEPEQGGTDARV